MPVSASPHTASSGRALTIAAHACFVPIGVVTVLLSPLLPTLSAKWSLSYSQAGALFTAQFLASTIAVLLSGVLIARWGFRFAIKTGLLIMAGSVAAVMSGSRILGLVCIAGYGCGLGLAVPAANLLVAEVNPTRRSAALNLLNFSWSTGAVACPFLVAAAARHQHVQGLLLAVAVVSVLVIIGIAAMPKSVEEPAVSSTQKSTRLGVPWRRGVFFVLASLFFVYVGTENSFGGWSASYANSLGSMSSSMAIMTPSFFYSALMLGRWVAPFFLRQFDEIQVAQTGLLLACAGMVGLIGSRAIISVAASAIASGLGLSAVYPITISLLSREFRSSASRIGSLMFTAANLGGSFMPWLVGALSGRASSLRVGLAVPVAGSVVMLALYRRKWSAENFDEQLLAD
jgi:fucose permease